MKRLFILPALLILFFASTAEAQPLQEAEKLNQQARAAYDKGDFAEALGLFKQAFEALPNERYLFNSAKACYRLEDSEGAIYFYQRYLAFNPTAKDRKKVEKEVARLRKRLVRQGRKEIRLDSEPTGAAISLEPAYRTEVKSTPGVVFLKPGSHTVVFVLAEYEEKRIGLEVGEGADSPTDVLAKLKRKAAFGEFELVCNQPGARVFLEDSYLGTTPLARQRVKAGDHSLRLEKEGFHPRQLEMVVTVGETARVEAELEAVVPEPKIEKPIEVDKKRRLNGGKIASIVVGGVGVVAAGVGAYLWYDGWADMHRNQYYENEYNDAETTYHTGIGLTIGGGVVAAAATMAFLLIPDDGEAKATTVTLVPSFDGWSFSLQTRF